MTVPTRHTRRAAVSINTERRGVGARRRHRPRCAPAVLNTHLDAAVPAPRRPQRARIHTASDARRAVAHLAGAARPARHPRPAHLMTATRETKRRARVSAGTHARPVHARLASVAVVLVPARDARRAAVGVRDAERRGSTTGRRHLPHRAGATVVTAGLDAAVLAPRRALSARVLTRSHARAGVARRPGRAGLDAAPFEAAVTVPVRTGLVVRAVQTTRRSRRSARVLARHVRDALPAIRMKPIRAGVARFWRSTKVGIMQNAMRWCRHSTKPAHVTTSRRTGCAHAVPL